MEPASLDTEKAPRTGTLDNPEVVENVPGHVIPILVKEFDDFDTESTRYLKGALQEDDFIKFRLKQGVYGQRQPDVQMLRVKLPMGGVTPDQLDAFADSIDRHLPLRKGKTAFTATDADNAITQIHDVAFIPRVRDGVRGVEMRVGGGTSIMPRIAPTLYEFVELDNGDYLKITEACMRIFDRTEFLRVNRARARIKVLIDKIGIEAFRELVEEELEGDWVAERDFSLDEILFDYNEEANVPDARGSYD